ncbi:glycosyltransferase [Nonomuraea sp. ATR24]|uniref:glycosyltransferase family 2 protein n=1 Tax=Nonomuraea sp. ATR24 TaxID=1676744 RepID=UPI0035BF6F52
MHGSRSGLGRWLVAGIGAVAAAASWIAFYRLTFGQADVDPALLVYMLTTGVLVVVLVITAVPRRFTHLPIASGRVVAIVPSYNEDPAALRATIEALLAGTVVPDEIRVVDDGSDQRVEWWSHRRIRWHYQRNAGKREAQARVLYELRHQRDQGAPAADFILTVDSDSVVDRRALQHLLRAMSDPRVQAATGLPLVRNRGRSWLTALTDLEMTSACLTLRAARSRMGVVAPCSGALSLYRADLVLDNLDDYVTSGTAGDDRRLTHYALQRGQAVAVDEALVHTDMPHTLRGMYRQRVRWYRSYWLYALWEVANLPRLPMLWRAYALVMSALTPIALAWITIVAPLAGQGLQWHGLVYWLGLTYSIGLRYAISRPGMPAWQRVAVWLLLTPPWMLVQLLLMRPAMWQALFQARTTAWSTRGPAATATPSAPAPSAAAA